MPELREDERRQRRRRILEPEVAIRELTVEHVRAVALIDVRVDLLAALPEADVGEEKPRGQQQRAAGEQRAGHSHAGDDLTGEPPTISER